MSIVKRFLDFFSRVDRVTVVATDGKPWEISYLSHWQRYSPIDLDQVPVQKTRWDLYQTDGDSFVMVRTVFQGGACHSVSVSRDCARVEQLVDFVVCPNLMKEFSKLARPSDVIEHSAALLN